MEQKDDIILRLDHVTQEFPGVKALDDVSFDIKRGHIHALVGENGAGKSTLIKILAGINTSYKGEVYFNGQKFHPKNPNESQISGISVVHQELMLAETLSVTENIFLGHMITGHGIVQWPVMRKQARKLLDSLGIDLNENAIVSELTVAQKQIVEICKAINRECQVLIMDEPSAVLTDNELKILFSVIHKLSAEGITIIYISHKMDEIFQLCEDLTVLRDGQHIETRPVAGLNLDQLITMMVGRKMGMNYPKEAIPLGEPVLEVQNLGQKGVFSGVSFTLHKGEILGISGLVGAGRTETMKAIVGIEHPTEGKIIFKGKEIENHTFKEAINRGIGFVPEDRKQEGLVQVLNLIENTCMASWDKVIHRGIIRRTDAKKYTKKYVNDLKIACPNIETEVQFLSGGNQQKVVLAKWLMRGSDILILDEPTRGIDVAAKMEIYHLMTELVKQGKSIIMISSEMPEIIGMSDNVIVMHDRKMAGKLKRNELSQEKIMSYCV